jgi:hypothetical protein
MNVRYRGGQTVEAYFCRNWEAEPGPCHLCFSAGKAEEAVVEQLLEAVSGPAIEAALQAAEEERKRQGEHRRALELGLEQARYQARLAERRYEAADPDQRLVTRELEARWNVALERVAEAEARCIEFEQRLATRAVPDRELLLSLAQDLPAVWNACSDRRLKQRIVHLVLREILVEIEASTVTFLLHWAGGRHSEERWKKRERVMDMAKQSPATALEVISKMAARFSDCQIAATLNKLQLPTPSGRGWSKGDVAQTRESQNLPVFQPNIHNLSPREAAQRAKVSTGTILNLIRRGILPASRIVELGPWEISADALSSEPVQQAIARLRRRGARISNHERQQRMFSDI